tara:strand:- start:75 stop:176 length:102 start_codon:yes stop_codon:yes gene_type:complete
MHQHCQVADGNLDYVDTTFKEVGWASLAAAMAS